MHLPGWVSELDQQISSRNRCGNTRDSGQNGVSASSLSFPLQDHKLEKNCAQQGNQTKLNKRENCARSGVIIAELKSALDQSKRVQLSEV